MDSYRRILRGGQHNLPLPSAETAGLIPSEAAPAAFFKDLKDIKDLKVLNVVSLQMKQKDSLTTTLKLQIHNYL